MWPLPQDTRALLDQHTSDNLFLRYYRYVGAWQRNRNEWQLEGTHKTDYLRTLTQTPPPAAVDALQAYHARTLATLRQMEASGLWAVRQVEGTTAARLIAGLGYKGALEVGLTLHPLYGFPYLPATSVKGVARAWAEHLSAPYTLGILGKATKHGAEDAEKRLGLIRFWDALPMAYPRLELDVMTPHAGPYYQEPATKPPAAWHDPTPITFLTVAANTPFVFPLVAPRDAAAHLDTAAAWLTDGLTHLGIGGKTSAGYGAFQSTAPSKPAPFWKDLTFYKKPKSAYEPGPKRTRVTKNSILPAKIVGREGRALLVQVHVESRWLNKPGATYPLGGINADSFKVGEWVGVYPQLTKKKKIHGVTWATAKLEDIP